MRTVRTVALIVMIAALVVAVFVIANNIVAVADAPEIIRPIIEALPEQGSAAALILTGAVVAVGVIASVVHKRAKRALEQV